MPASALGYCYDGCGSLVENIYFAAYLLLILLSCIVKLHSFSPPFFWDCKAVGIVIVCCAHV
jgi:hypothetical protein